MSRKVVQQAGGAPARTPASERDSSGSAWRRLPLGAKILLPIFALTLCTALGAALFFTPQLVAQDRAVQAGEGKAVAIAVQGALAAMPDDPSSIGEFLRHVDLAYQNVAALCVLTVNPSDPLGPLVVYSSGGLRTTCDPGSPLLRGVDAAGVASGLRQTAAGQVEEIAVAASLSGYGGGAVVEVQVRLTPVAELAVPLFGQAAAAGILLAVFQTGVVFSVLWISALRPLKQLRMKASAAALSARHSSPDAIAAPNRSGDEIHDLSLRFEELLGAVRDRELELLESHDKLETLISNSPVTVFSTDGEGILLQIEGHEIGSIANDLGPDGIVGMSLLDLVHPNAEFTGLVQRALAGEKVHEVVAVRSWPGDAGTPGPAHLDVVMSPTHQGDGRLIGITGLAVNVSDRMDAASARAESRQKSAFLAAMSHELRTPLNSIMGFSQLLQMLPNKSALTAKQRRYVGHIYSSGEHLLALVSDILDLAKVGAGQMEVNLGPVAVHDEVKDPVDKMRPLALEKGLTIEMDIPLGLTSYTDRLRVRQILLNLLTNAVKFTAPDGGPIVVTARRSGEGVEVAVADSGIGIALEEQDRIFEEFTQVDRGPSRRIDGTGLGLTLTKRMVELIGGNIRVESKLGLGSTFTVWLPGAGGSSDSPQLAASAS